MSERSLSISGPAAFLLACLAIAGVGTVWHLWGDKAAGIAATLVTFAAIAWTAYETAALRAETVQQTEIEQRPFIVLEDERAGYLKLRNVGRGAALDVHVGDSPVAIVNAHILETHYRLRFLIPLPALGPGEPASVPIHLFSHNALDIERASVTVEFDLRGAARQGADVVVPITYSDVLGKARTERWRLNRERGVWGPA